MKGEGLEIRCEREMREREEREEREVCERETERERKEETRDQIRVLAERRGPRAAHHVVPRRARDGGRAGRAEIIAELPL